MQHIKAFKQAINDLSKQGYVILKDQQTQDLLKAIWERCESSIESTPKKLPTLLGGQPKVPQKKEVQKRNQFNISEADLQFLVGVLSELINCNDRLLASDKDTINQCWIRCDKDNKDTRSTFEFMNEVKDFYRSTKKLNLRLGAIQGKLKKQLRYT